MSFDVLCFTFFLLFVTYRIFYVVIACSYFSVRNTILCILHSHIFPCFFNYSTFPSLSLTEALFPSFSNPNYYIISLFLLLYFYYYFFILKKLLYFPPLFSDIQNLSLPSFRKQFIQSFCLPVYCIFCLFFYSYS